MKTRLLIKAASVLSAAAMLLTLGACGSKTDEVTTEDTAPGTSQTAVQAADEASRPDFTAVSTTAQAGAPFKKQETLTVNGAAPDLRCYIYYSSEKDYVYGSDIANRCTVVMLDKGKAHNLNYFNPAKSEKVITGIPVIFDFDRSQNPKRGYKYPEQLRITCDGGSFSTIVNGEETVYTGSTTLGTGYGTIYWICGKPGEKTVSKGEITAEYISGGEVIASQTAVISRGSVSHDSGDNIYYNYRIKIK